VGGSPTNIAVGARRLGLETALITAVGEDPVGDFILHFLNQEEVTTTYIPRKAGTRTPAVLLGIEPPDKFPLVFYRANAADIQLTEDDLRSVPLAGAGAFEFAGTNLAKSPLREATFHAVQTARSAGGAVYMDLDFRADQWSDPLDYGRQLRSILPLVDVAIGTEEEIKAAVLRRADQVVISDSAITAPNISGDLEAAIEKILLEGCGALVVKRGERGAAVHLPDGEVIAVPGFPVEVLNLLGAGDAFASGLIYGRSQGWEWYPATRMGNACGAILVTKHGVANFMPTEQQALAFVEEMGGL
jgi:5-dehydro-2-deoxygluconokinase